MKGGGEILKDDIKELEEDINLLKTCDKVLVDRNTPEMKCFKCDFVANTDLSLNKPFNKKHEPKSDQLSNQK